MLFLNFLNLFYFQLRWVFVAARSLSLVVSSRGYSSLPWAGFSLRWLLLLWSMGSRYTGFSSCGTWAQLLSSCGSQALECRLNSCGTRAQLLCGMWDLSGLGLKPMCPALAGDTREAPVEQFLCDCHVTLKSSNSEVLSWSDVRIIRELKKNHFPGPIPRRIESGSWGIGPGSGIFFKFPRWF